MTFVDKPLLGEFCLHIAACLCERDGVGYRHWADTTFGLYLQRPLGR